MSVLERREPSQLEDCHFAAAGLWQKCGHGVLERGDWQVPPRICLLHQAVRSLWPHATACPAGSCALARIVEKPLFSCVSGLCVRSRVHVCRERKDARTAAPTLDLRNYASDFTNNFPMHVSLPTPPPTPRGTKVRYLPRTAPRAFGRCPLPYSGSPRAERAATSWRPL